MQPIASTVISSTMWNENIICSKCVAYLKDMLHINNYAIYFGIIIGKNLFALLLIVEL